MAVYNTPKELALPKLNWENIDQYQPDCDKFVEDLKALLSSPKYNLGGKNFGEIIKFQVADGYAEYMVIGMSPVKLMHLPFMDGYQFEYAHLLKAKDINDKIAQEKALKQLFSKKDLHK